MIYFVQADIVGHIKIGFHGGTDVNDRIRELQTGCPSKLIVLGTLPGGLETEADLHRQFAFAHLHGEWFKPVPELLAFIGKLPAGPSLGKTEVRSRFVQIKVLTVDGRKFTKALFDQLPGGDPIDWKLSQPFTPLVERGDVWGGLKVISSTQERLAVLWDREGLLFRYFVDWNHEPPWNRIPWFKDFSRAGSKADFEALKKHYLEAYDAVCRKWRSLDQLYIGV
jgi:hypothetical protein